MKTSLAPEWESRSQDPLLPRGGNPLLNVNHPVNVMMITLRTWEVPQQRSDHPEWPTCCVTSARWDSNCQGAVVDSGRQREVEATQCQPLQAPEKTPWKSPLECDKDLGQVELQWMNQEQYKTPSYASLGGEDDLGHLRLEAAAQECLSPRPQPKRGGNYLACSLFLYSPSLSPPFLFLLFLFLCLWLVLWGSFIVCVLISLTGIFKRTLSPS